MVGFLKKLTGKGENFYLEIKDDETQPSAPVAPQAQAPAAPAPIVSEPAPTPELAVSAAPAPVAPAPVVVAPAPEPPKPAPQPDVTFAPDYLLTTKTFAKRRPGPSMAKFMTLAQQVKR